MMDMTTMQTVVSVIEKDIAKIYGVTCKGYLESQGMGITFNLTTEHGAFSFFLNVRDNYDLDYRQMIENLSARIDKMREIFIPKSDSDELVKQLKEKDKIIKELEAKVYQLHENIDFHFEMIHGRKRGSD